MIYWIAKIFQATALGLLGWGFISYYPNLMPHKIFLVAGLFFIIGWTIQTYFLKK